MIKGYCDPRFINIKKLFVQAIESEFEVGASLAIEHKGEMVVNLWGGHKDAARTHRWEEDTLVNVWSVTKGVTATCIARLIDQNYLDPDHKVSYYWPEYGCNGKEDTKVSDFLCHRSGMFAFQEGMPEGSWQDWKKFTRKLEAQAPFKEPGSSQGYHALTYGWLVGELIRRVDGRSVGQYFQEEIARPLNIDFHIGLQESDFNRCADMLMDASLNNLNSAKLPGNFIRYIPDLFLSKQLKNLKSAVLGGDFFLAFQTRETDSDNYPNTPDWRLAEIPSANGHGTAEGLAKLYGILSTGCNRDGISIMKPDTLTIATTPYSNGPDSVLFGSNMKFGLGYELEHGLNSPGNLTPKFRKNMFGHAGVGGAVAFGDIHSRVGFAFLCNKQHKTRDLYRTNNALVECLYSLL